MELLTIEEMAGIFKAKRKTIDNWLYSGTLPRTLTVKIGRNVYFVKSKVDEFIESKFNKNEIIEVKNETEITI